MLKIGLFGVAGHNRGDDAISLSVIEGLRRNFGGCEITVAVLKGAQIKLHGADRVVVIDRKSPAGLWRLLRAIWRVDAVLLGGGSLIQDRLGASRVKGVIGYAWTVTTFARVLGRPVYTVPLGVDELRTETAVRVARAVVANIRWIALRDRLSHSQLQRIGGPVREAAVFCDPAFVWDPPLMPPAQAGSIVLAPAFENVDDALVTAMFARIASELVSRDPSTQLTILAMDGRVSTDGGKLREIYDALPPDAKFASSMLVPDSAECAASVLRHARAVIAMRLHAIILAYGHARCFCLSRTTKTTALLNEFDVDGMEYADAPLDRVVARAVASVDDETRLAAQKSRLGKLRALQSSYYDQLRQRLQDDGILKQTAFA